nr:hypothetical protein [uncultured Rhodopila sp.]
MQLRLVTPVADGFQPALTAKHRSADLRRQHDTASSQFSLSGIVDGGIIGVFGILGCIIGAGAECFAAESFNVQRRSDLREAMNSPRQRERIERARPLTAAA